MRIIEGWRRMDNKRGYVNETTEQNLVVTKKEFGEHYLVMLFPMMENDQGKEISPGYAAESKAEAFAVDWMTKHPRGIK